jgi:hypothetical protein
MFRLIQNCSPTPCKLKVEKRAKRARRQGTMLSRNERIDRKTQLLEQLEPKREVGLEGIFTDHVVDAIRASSPRERQQAIDKATEAYEDALDSVLYEYGGSWSD